MVPFGEVNSSRAGAAPTCQSSGEHVWLADHGVDGKRGRDSCQCLYLPCCPGIVHQPFVTWDMSCCAVRFMPWGDLLVLKAIVNNSFKNRHPSNPSFCTRNAPGKISLGFHLEASHIAPAETFRSENYKAAVIALRSVTLPTHSATEDYTRGEVLSASFTIWEELDTVTKVSYYNQANPGVLPYISRDIAGLSSNFCTTFISCSKFHTRSCFRVNGNACSAKKK